MGAVNSAPLSQGGIVDIAVFALILAATALGGALVILTVVITGFLCFKLKREPGEAFFQAGQAKGDAFVVDDMLDAGGGRRPPPFADFGEVEKDAASEVLDRQTARFLEQLKEEKVKDE
jgi:hypothetical protein